MPRFVVEPPLAVKWFVPEDGSSRSSRLLDGGNDLLALDNLVVEACMLVAAKTRLGELTIEEAHQVVAALSSVPLVIFPVQPLLEPGLDIAAAFDRPLGDALNLALAVQNDCRLVTCQRSLYEAVQGTSFAMHLKWVEDIR